MKRALILFMIFCLGPFLVMGDELDASPPSSIITGLNDTADQSIAFEALDLTDEELRDIAEKIFNLTKSVSDEFYISDGLTLAVYILKYMAEIGEFELVHKDMMALVKAFENIQGTAYDENIYIVLEQIKKLKFGTRDGKAYVKFFSKSEKGIIYHINEKVDEPDSSLKEIKHVTIKDGAEMHFEEVDTKKEQLDLVKWVKSEYRIKTFGKYMLHEDIPNFIESFFDLQTPANAMKVNYKGFVVRIETSSIFKGMNLKFKDGYVLPSFRKGEKPIPSFMIRMNAKLIKIKISVDQ